MNTEVTCKKCGELSGQTVEQYTNCTIVYDVRCHKCGGIVNKDIFKVTEPEFIANSY